MLTTNRIRAFWYWLPQLSSKQQRGHEWSSQYPFHIKLTCIAGAFWQIPMYLIRYLDRPGPEETKKIIGFKVTEGKRKYLCANVFPHTYLAKTISIASWLVFVPLNSLKESLWLQNKAFTCNVGLLSLITLVVEKLHWKEAMQDSEYNPRRSKAWPWDEKSL